MFARDIWYPVMWSEELLPGNLISRRILGDPIVFVRSIEGAASALFDMCPHRQVPLHLGRVTKSGAVQCMYHGLEFGAQGQCTHNPHGGITPAGLKVRSYPVVEKHTAIWIWMGLGTPDESSIPDFSLMDEKDDGQVRGRAYLHIAANYLLVADNLLDLSHAAFLHEGILGLPEHSSATVSVQQTGKTISCKRVMPNVNIAEMHDLLYKRDKQKIDMWNEVRWDPPASLILTHGFSRPGGAEPFQFAAVHLLTPESETSTHYSYGIVRVPALDEESVQQKVADIRKHVFEDQDRVVLEKQQKLQDENPGLGRPVLLGIDGASVRMRRVIDQIIAAENVPQAA